MIATSIPNKKIREMWQGRGKEVMAEREGGFEKPSNGALYAALFGKDKARNLGLERSSNLETDFFHDDDEVLEHSGGKIRTTKTIG